MVFAGVSAWTTSGTATADIRALAIDPAHPATLYAGTSGSGVLKSTDGGESWTPANVGLASPDVGALALDPSNPAALYAGTSGGQVFRSADGGLSWSATPFLGFPVKALTADPSAPTTIYAGTYGGGVFRSTNSGATWTAANSGLQHFGVQALIVNPAAPGTLYAGTSNAPGPFDYCTVGACGGGLFKSTDSGVSWNAAGNGLTNQDVRTLAIPFSSPATLYAGTGGGVLKSTDAGASAISANEGLTNLDVKVVTVDPSNPATLYAGTSADLFRSVNGGASWAASNTGLTNAEIHALAIDPVTPTTMYAGTPVGVFKSRDGGRTWNTGNPANGACVLDATTLCLSRSRFQVRAQWFTTEGRSGPGQVIPITGDTGGFWFFNPSSLEVIVKVLNGCAFNSRYWTFAAGLTNVQVVLTVTDTQTGTVRTYSNPQGISFEPIQDTAAFAACP